MNGEGPDWFFRTARRACDLCDRLADPLDAITREEARAQYDHEMNAGYVVLREIPRLRVVEAQNDDPWSHGA